jgi:hypothetical protein
MADFWGYIVLPVKEALALRSSRLEVNGSLMRSVLQSSSCSDYSLLVLMAIYSIANSCISPRAQVTYEYLSVSCISRYR